MVKQRETRREEENWLIQETPAVLECADVRKLKEDNMGLPPTNGAMPGSQLSRLRFNHGYRSLSRCGVRLYLEPDAGKLKRSREIVQKRKERISHEYEIHRHDFPGYRLVALICTRRR
jgi:hypothetical protein